MFIRDVVKIRLVLSLISAQFQTSFVLYLSLNFTNNLAPPTFAQKFQFHLAIKLDPLTPKMAFFLDLGLLKPVKLQIIKFGLLGFCTSKAKFRERAQAAGLHWLAWPGWPKPSPRILPLTYKTSKVRTSNASYDFQKAEIQKIRSYS